MGKQVDVCSMYVNGKVIYFYRIVSDRKVEASYKISRDEYTIINEIIRSRGYKKHYTKFLGLPSYCFTYYNVDEETINVITKKYGKLIPKPGDG